MGVGSQHITLRVEIEQPNPIVGWIEGADCARTRFEGWLELISELQRVIATACPEPDQESASR
ncbi:MAG TPA: hypothetical protein VGF95_06110 [Solirubrobacteraceae bacterium]|jgi:hypothetical protein